MFRYTMEDSNETSNYKPVVNFLKVCGWFDQTTVVKGQQEHIFRKETSVELVKNFVQKFSQWIDVWHVSSELCFPCAVLYLHESHNTPLLPPKKLAHALF